MTPTYFCICDEEWCWCSNRVATPEEACPDCRGGKHVMDPPPSLPTNPRNCAMCAAGVPGRHPDRGGTHPLVNA